MPGAWAHTGRYVAGHASYGRRLEAVSLAVSTPPVRRAAAKRHTGPDPSAKIAPLPSGGSTRPSAKLLPRSATALIALPGIADVGDWAQFRSARTFGMNVGSNLGEKASSEFRCTCRP
jgi:hypothetical protein